MRKIDIFVQENYFVAYSGAFTNHKYSPLKAKFSKLHTFYEANLEKNLTLLKKYADKLTLEDLVPIEKLKKKKLEKIWRNFWKDKKLYEALIGK